MNSDCSICLESIKKSEHRIILKRCKHQFHKDCIMNWILQKNSCPLCRTPVKTQFELTNHGNKFNLKISEKNFSIDFMKDGKKNNTCFTYKSLKKIETTQYNSNIIIFTIDNRKIIFYCDSYNHPFFISKSMEFFINKEISSS